MRHYSLSAWVRILLEQLRKHKLFWVLSHEKSWIMVWLQFKWAWVRYVKHIWELIVSYSNVEKQWNIRWNAGKSIVVTIDEMLRTCFNMVTTTWPLQTADDGHYNQPLNSPQHRPLQSATTPRSLPNSLQRWSLRIRYNDGHYKLLQYGHYNLATTCLYDLPQPRHYEFTTTRSLQTHYNIFTITPLQYLPLPIRHNQSLCYNQGHHN